MRPHTQGASSAKLVLPRPTRSHPPSFGHGLISAAEVLSFLIECIARRDGGGASGASGGDEYAVFGLQMAHRALLAAGPALRRHVPLVGVLHRELFPAMAAAVRGAGGGMGGGARGNGARDDKGLTHPHPSAAHTPCTPPPPRRARRRRARCKASAPSRHSHSHRPTAPTPPSPRRARHPWVC